MVINKVVIIKVVINKVVSGYTLSKWLVTRRVRFIEKALLYSCTCLVPNYSFTVLVRGVTVTGENDDGGPSYRNHSTM